MQRVRIAVISHAFVDEIFRNRWYRLASDPKYEVHLLTPKYWISNWFGERVEFEPKEIHEANFHLHTLKTTSRSKWHRFFFISLSLNFKRIKPDIIYIVHKEGNWIHHQVYRVAKLFAPRAKIIFFSMNALGVPRKTIIHRLMWADIKRNTVAALAHYPGCLISLRNGGYKHPVFLQTQVGVDENVFKFDLEMRDKIRKRIKMNNHYVIGFTGRVNEDKGVDTLWEAFKALAGTYDSMALLIVGNGQLREIIEKEALANKLENRVHITGYVPQESVPAYMNAMDNFVLASKTMPNWIDTFPLVTVQAQACRIPVIASDSGSIPWQLSDSAILFREGNTQELIQAIEYLYLNKIERYEIAEKGYKRSLDFFCHKGMTENFKQILDQVINDDFKYHEPEDPYIQWKAYK